jgi:hypothetical protein
MATTRNHTMTMFRDNADTNAVFSQLNTDGVSHFSIEKAEEEGDSTTLFTLGNEGFNLLKNWAKHCDINSTEVILSCINNEYQLKIASSKTVDGLKFVKCPTTGKKKTLLLLDDHQAKRFVSWLNRTQS